MVVLSVVFLKFMLSAMSVVPSGVEVIPWTIFVVAIAKTGRKIDALIMRIGLNPAATGDPLGGIARMPGMLTYIVARNMVQNIGKSAAAGASHNGQSGSMRPGGAGASPTPPARPGPVSGGGAAVVRSSAEFAAETTAGPMQANPQTAGGGNTASRGQTASRPPVGRDRRATDTVPQNMGNSARNHSDISMTTPAESAQNRNPAQPATQNGGRNTVSTEARRASAPTAARPTAQTRTAQTAGMVQNAGQSGTKPRNPMGGAANLPGAGNATIFHTGRNTADSTLLRTNPADIRSSAPASQTAQCASTAHSTNRTENTAHSESVSVRQNQTTGRPPMQNGTPRPNSVGGDRQARPSIHGGGALRQNGTAEGRQSRPDVLWQNGRSQESSQAQERMLTQETVKMTGEALHSQTHMQAAPIFGGARPTAGKVAGDAFRPVSGRETMRGAAVQKAVRDSVPEKGLKAERTGRSNAVPNREHSPNAHRQSPAEQGIKPGRGMAQRQRPTAANPLRGKTGDEHK